MDYGYVKIYRKLLNNLVFQNSNLLKVWIWCLLKASHKEHEQLVGLTKVKLMPGQFIFGRNMAAEELNMKPATVYKYMCKLKDMKNLSIKSSNKFSIVTIANWDFYQANSENGSSKSSNKVAATWQQRSTNKNDKNVNKKKNVYAEFVTMTAEEYGKLVEKYGEANTKKMIEKLDNYKGSKGKKYKDDYRAILNWVVDEVLGKQTSSRPEGFEVIR